MRVEFIACSLWAVLCGCLCFASVGSEGKSGAMTAVLIFSIFLLVLALSGLVWALDAKRAEAETQYHQSVQRPPHAKLIRAWTVLAICAFGIMICAAIFVGDWKANGPDGAGATKGDHPDHIGTNAAGETVGFWPWTTGEKFVCANWDRSNSVYKDWREFGGRCGQHPAAPHGRCSSAARAGAQSARGLPGPQGRNEADTSHARQMAQSGVES